MPLVDMKLSKAEAKEDTKPTAVAKMPEYPWGTQITLDERALKKLKIDGLPEVGTLCGIDAVGKITGASVTDTEDGGQNRTVTIQIQKIEIEDAGEEESEEAAEDAKGDTGGGFKSAAKTVARKGY